MYACLEGSVPAVGVASGQRELPGDCLPGLVAAARSQGSDRAAGDAQAGAAARMYQHRGAPAADGHRDSGSTAFAPPPAGPCRAGQRQRRERLHNSLVARYHYLGYRQPTGAALKYLCYCGERVVAALGFGAAAWKVACRDAFIGWEPAVREANLPGVVNNDRFVILPWVRVPHLASFLLGHCLRRLRRDWMAHYATPIVLAETFVERERFAGTCYRAANWRRLGETRGRGRNDRTHRNAEPVRDVLVYPLCRRFRERLCQSKAMPRSRGDGVPGAQP